MRGNFQKLNAELGAEFDRYVAEHPAWAQKHIQPGARIALRMGGNSSFNSGVVSLPNVRGARINR